MRIDERTARALDEHCRQAGETRSAVIRRLIEGHLAERPRRSAAEVYDEVTGGRAPASDHEPASRDHSCAITKGGVEAAPIEPSDLDPLERLIAKYRDQQMDFADASLVLLADRTGIGAVATFDRRQFEVCRFRNGRRFVQGLPALMRRSPRKR